MLNKSIPVLPKRIKFVKHQQNNKNNNTDNIYTPC